jgi:hypothetical protein
MFGTVSLPANNFKRLLGSGSPSAEYARDSSAPSATEFFSLDASELILGF